MLVLSRKCNETIVIGDNIHIKVVGIGGNQVRLGIEAPSDVRIMRDELLRGKEAHLPEQPSTPAHSMQRPPLAASRSR
jgi:carbon storage regulator